MPVATILLVDDHEPFREFMRLLLQQRTDFLIVAEAADGVDAVRQTEELQPDIVLLDVGLPGLNGIDVARQAKRRALHTKFLFVSQDSSPEVVGEAFRWGADGYIHKMRVVMDLLPAVAALVNGERFLSSGLTLPDETTPHSFHEVQLYSDDPVLVDRLWRFVAHHLTAGNPAIVLATKPHREALAMRLKAEGINVDAAIRQGTYVPLDAADVLSKIMVDGMPDAALFRAGLLGLIDAATKAARREAPRVAIAGECVGLLSAEGELEAAMALEKIGNELIADGNVEILCAYPLLHCRDDDTFDRICAVHTGAGAR